MATLKEYVSFNSDFRDSVNLYLDLNKKEKINSYIPTKSSVDILKQYIMAVEDNKQQSTLLIGPYGKGKSHLLLLLLAILSMERNGQNQLLVEDLVTRVEKVDSDVSKSVLNLWNKKGRFLPVLIMSTQGDLNQAFMVGLNDALKREGLTELTPETYYTYALDTINRWRREYSETYDKFLELLHDRNVSIKSIIAGLKNCDSGYLDVFKEIYPELTSGSTFNPLVNSEVLPMYKNIADKLVEEYQYSGIYIVFDEFSKYIEGQDKKSAGNNMKLLQDMCELANSSKNSQVFLTMVAHKGIKEYGKYLSMETINSFTGIEGRIREIYFVTSSKNNYELIQNAIFKKKGYETITEIKKHLSDEKIEAFYKMVAFSTVFTKNDFAETVLKGCYPLSPTSAYLLLNVSEKVAQNERTLFTFISKEEQHSMAKYVADLGNGSKDWIISSDLIYDYFKGLFKKDVNNEYVHNEWLNSEYALSKVSEYNQRKMIKTLAIINIVNKPDELPADEQVLKLAAGVPDPDATITTLVEKGLIYKKGSNNCYVFKTRATSEIKSEIKKRKNLRGARVNVNNVLAQISDVQYVLPKRYNDTYTMTRYFRYEFLSVEEFLNIDNYSVLVQEGKFCDGKVIALYSLNDTNYHNKIVERLSNSCNTELVVLYNAKKLELLNQIQEYEIIQELKRDIQFFSVEENKVLEKEIPILEEDLRKEIFNYLDECFGEKSGKTAFYYSAGQLISSNRIKLSEIIDDICYEIYPDAVSVNNELINKEIISTSPIKKARKTIIETLLSKGETEQFMTGTSAEATIYRALFVGTGIKDEKHTPNAKKVMELIDEFIVSAGDTKKSLKELCNVLTSKPIGMRRGVIPLFLAYSLGRRNEDIVIYFGKKEVPLNAEMVLNMCEMPGDYYIFISMDDVQKEEYLQSLCDLFGVKNANSKTESRISNILTSMQRWFRALPQVTKNIKNQETYFDNKLVENAFAKVKKILQNVEANPYEVLFVELPGAFQVTNDYIRLYELIVELRKKLNGYYDWIIQRAVSETILIFDKKARYDLHHTLVEWYEEQSDLAKHGLHSSQVTGLMSLIADNKSFDDAEILKKVVKAITEVYVDSWNDSSLVSYMEELKKVKIEIESIGEDVSNDGKLELSFVGKAGEKITRYYEHISEGTGVILKNILSDTLEDFSDLTVNDKVAILLEMIEKELG